MCPLSARVGLELILGPPGCGKTHEVIKRFLARVAAGVPASRIACLTFSRAGRRELEKRLAGEPGITKADLVWVRTIHGASVRLHGERGAVRLMGKREWREFAAKHHYRLTRIDPRADVDGDEPELRVPPQVTSDDALRHAYDWGRNVRLTTSQTLARYRCAALRPDQFELYVRRYEAFKRERGLSDFLDLLEDVLEQGLRPDVEVIQVDEAQELSPLQLAVLAMWVADCPDVCLAADEDQAVHGFQGGDAAWLVDLSKGCPTTILKQSWRVPAKAHAIAQAITARNRVRVAKDYLPRPAAGEVLRLPLAHVYRLLDGSRSTFVLARNRFFLCPVARELIARLVPFVVEGGGAPSPLSNPRLLTAVRTSLALHRRDGERFPAASIAQLLTFVPLGELAGKEARASLNAAARAGKLFTLDELVALHGLGALLQRIDSNGPFSCFESVPERTRRYLAGLHAKYGEIPRPAITLTSIHGAKGREAELVVVLSDMSAASYRQCRGKDHEEENRIFYVACTRTRHTLVLVEPQGRRYFEFPKPVAVAAGDVEADAPDGSRGGAHA